MNSPWFFLSYASIDPKFDSEYEKHVEEFCAHLVKAVRIRAQANEADEVIGFCAPNMREGTHWKPELVGKLASCRVLVCLWSDRYFRSEMCGKEFEIFRSRCNQDFGVIVPVLWVVSNDFENRLPRAARDLHYKYPGYELARRVEGVYYLKAQPGNSSEYDAYIKHLAKTVSELALRDSVGRLPTEPDFTDVWNAFVDPPAAPSGLDAVIRNREIRLTWENNSTNEQGFYIKRWRKDGRPDFVLLKSVDAGSKSYTDTGVEPGTIYRYRVCAFNSGGCSSEVESVEVETPGQPPPPMPSDLRPKLVSAFEIDLCWQDNSAGSAGFQIERRLATEARFSINKVGPGISEYHDAGLSPATNYVYRICAFNDNGNSDYSDPLPVRTPDKPPPPPPPPIPILPILVVAVVIVMIAAAWFFRCPFIPSLCSPTPTPSPSPKPTIGKTYWSDAFLNNGSPEVPQWQKAGSWDTPGWQPRWESNITNGVLVIKGTGTGVVKASYYDNFELLFPVDFEVGGKAGWIVRAQGDQKSGYTGYCFVLERTLDAFQLIGYWGTPQQLSQNRLDPQRIPITEYGVANDSIEVAVTAEGDTIKLVFHLVNPENDGRRQLDSAECFTAKAHINSKEPSAGYVGVFGVDPNARFSIDTVEVNPITPQATRLVTCERPGPEFNIK